MRHRERTGLLSCLCFAHYDRSEIDQFLDCWRRDRSDGVYLCKSPVPSSGLYAFNIVDIYRDQ